MSYDPKKEIEELKQKVKRSEIEIAELKQQLKTLRQDQECSAQKIKSLEDNKKGLENEVDKHKKKISWLEEEVRYFSNKHRFTDLSEKLKENDAKLESIEQSFQQKLNDAVSKLAKENRDLREEVRDNKESLKINQARTDKLEHSRNVLYVGQLCAMVMEEIYRQVLPVYFETRNHQQKKDYKQPHLREIDVKIREYCQLKEEKEEAQRRWKEVQDEIDADPDNVKKLIDFMEDKLYDRNKEAHPTPLFEGELKEIAEARPSEKQFLEKVMQIGKKYLSYGEIVLS